MVKTIFIDPDALQELYAIPRGTVAEVTRAIRALQANPTPPGSTLIADRPGRRHILVQGYTITYQITGEKIVILAIDQE